MAAPRPRANTPHEAKRRRLAGAVLVVLTVVLLLLNFDASLTDSAAHAAHPKTPDQTYQPTYPDRGGSFGVIYAANGPFVARAFRSAVVLGAGFNATLFSDVEGAKACANLRRLHRWKFADKLAGLRCAVANASTTFGFRASKLWAFTATPYDKSIYVDADAFPCASFEWLHAELSPALERYDILATHSSMRRGYAHALHWLNAGVIAFNSHHRTRRVFLDWLRTYEAQTAPMTDQRLFNEAALRSDARVMALPPEFNCKSNYKSVRYEWLKAASPYFYRHFRKDAACCSVPSVGICAIDHECRFPAMNV